MKGKVYFKDGHIEEIVNCIVDNEPVKLMGQSIPRMQVEFEAASGKYIYDESTRPIGALQMKESKFWKYQYTDSPFESPYMITEDIDRIELI